MGHKIERHYSGYIFHRFIRFTFSHFLSVTYGGLGVGVLGSWIGLLGLEVSVNRVWSLWRGASEFFDMLSSL